MSPIVARYQITRCHARLLTDPANLFHKNENWDGPPGLADSHVRPATVHDTMCLLPYLHWWDGLHRLASSHHRPSTVQTNVGLLPFCAVSQGCVVHTGIQHNLRLQERVLICTSHTGVSGTQQADRLESRTEIL